MLNIILYCSPITGRETEELCTCHICVQTFSKGQCHEIVAGVEPMTLGILFLCDFDFLHTDGQNLAAKKSAIFLILLGWPFSDLFTVYSILHVSFYYGYLG